MTRARRQRGADGEAAAEATLAAAGYVVLARNYRWEGGECDLVALDGRTVVFIEVKTRGSEAYGTPFEAVTPAKRRRVSRTALHYLARHGLYGRDVRFDVIGVWVEAGAPRCELIRDAFEGME